MTTFYLQQHTENGRWIIDGEFPATAHRIADSREADCWIAAKKAFGYALSPIQELLLEKFRSKDREAA